MHSPKPNPPERSFYAEHTKRWFDLIISALGLIVLGGPMAGVALMILLVDGRPALFRQTRIGRYGRPFVTYKFRTMICRTAEGAAITWAGDTRITWLGRWLRRWKLDELPQLFNVLLGHMSFVGPRPDVPGYADQLAGESARLLQLRPGITGLATQIFRDEETLLVFAQEPERFYDEVLFPAKVRLNLEYLERLSLFEDIHLILLTIFARRVEHPVRRQVEQLLNARSALR